MYSATTMLSKARHNNYLPENSQLYYRNIYLKSDHWKLLREEKLERNNKCEKCGEKYSLDIHHIKYKGLYDVRIEDLKTLCRVCHDKEHVKSSKKKNKKLTRFQRRAKRNLKKSPFELRRDIEKYNRLRLSLCNIRRQEKFDKTFKNYKNMNTYVSIHY